MSINYTSLAATATRLISENGRAATLRTFTESGPSYAPTQTPVDTAVTVVEAKLSQQDVDGSLVLTTDKAFLLDSSVEPDNTGKLVDAGEEYDIVKTVTIAPGPTTVLYKVFARL